MYPNNAYELYQAERTRTRAEVLAAPPSPVYAPG